MRSRKRLRRVFSVSNELLNKSREAALGAVQVFNNPNVTFKSETYIVLMVIAWTYLLHAYFRKRRINYRYFDQGKKQKRYHRTRNGAFKRWDLLKCLDDKRCPLDHVVVQNLKFLIGIRDEIEHQMTSRIDDLLSARFQSCCINYHEAVVKLFGEKFGIAKHLTVSLQFSALSQKQIDTLAEQTGLPKHIRKYIEGFDGGLSPDVFESPRFAYRVIFMPKTVNHPNQADQVIKFVKADSDIAKTANAAYAFSRETERPKTIPSMIVAKMKSEGFTRFGMTQHTRLWQALGAKDPAKGYGVRVAKSWYWYDHWVAEVRKHCESNVSKYK